MPDEITKSPGSLAGRPLIAVVDDDASFLRSLGRLLRSVGYATRTFNTGQEFLSSLSEGLPQCLVADMHMPVMSGLELQEKLAAQGHCVPVIFVTAFYNPLARERAHKAGCFAYMLKPVDKELLFRAIREATGSEASRIGEC